MKPLLPLLSLAPLAAAAQTRPYNIVYIMTDDHTAQMMSCYDSTNVRTPNLDRIAAEGVRFTNSYVANSLSGPSRACMLTGKHSHKNGFTNNEHGIFDGSQQTMPKLLQAAGYQTAIVGKWHLVSEPTGFDFWNIVPGQGDYYNPDFINQDGTTTREQGYITNIITDKAISWLENQRDTSRPFALFIHHKACHRDWLPELRYLHLFEDRQFPLPPTFHDDYAGRPAAAAQEMNIARDMTLDYDVKMYDPQHPTRLTDLYLSFIGRMDSPDRALYDQFYDSLALDFRARHLSGDALTEFKYQRYMRDYAKVTQSLDDNIGRTLDYLQQAGLLENTLVVYTSDQGFYMGEHGWFDKRFMYEESLATPLVMRLPDALVDEVNTKSGDNLITSEPRTQNFPRIIEEPVQNIDYAPTFLELAGAPIPDDIQGRSLLPLLRGEHPKDWRQAIYYHYHEYPAEHSVRRHYGIRTADGYKLMHFYPYTAVGANHICPNEVKDGSRGSQPTVGANHICPNEVNTKPEETTEIDCWELYDLNTDPHELHNVYGDPKYKKILRRLQRQLRQLQEEYDDPISALNNF